MWSLISRLVLKLAAIRWLFKLGGLSLLLPLALLLKTIGIPLLLILGVLALPLLFVLFLFGLPIFAVLLFGGLIMGVLSFVLTIGVAAIKIGIFVVLPIWLMWKLVCWIFRRGDSGPSAPPASPLSADPIEPDAGMEPGL
jgi:hypothetical protein